MKPFSKSGLMLLTFAFIVVIIDLITISADDRSTFVEFNEPDSTSIFLKSRTDSFAVDLTDLSYHVKHTVTATVYHAVAWQCNSQYWITADMSEIDTLHPDRHRWCAVSRDLLSEGFDMGDTIEVNGTWVYDGLWIIHDKMNKRYNDRIDFLTHKNQAQGKWSDVQIKLVGTKLQNS